MEARHISALVAAYVRVHECTEEQARELIVGDNLERRLYTYLGWNGIIGYTETILTIVECSE